jgi:hypothetical protein
MLLFLFSFLTLYLGIFPTIFLEHLSFYCFSYI